MGRVEHKERATPWRERSLAAGEREPGDQWSAVITVPRSALSAAGTPQVGDLLVVDIDGASRAVIVFQLTSDSAVVADVT